MRDVVRTRRTPVERWRSGKQAVAVALGTAVLVTVVSVVLARQGEEQLPPPTMPSSNSMPGTTTQSSPEVSAPASTSVVASVTTAEHTAPSQPGPLTRSRPTSGPGVTVTGGTVDGPTTTVPAPVPPPPTPVSHLVQGGNKGGSPTFADTKALVPGPRPVNYLEQVEVVCKVLDPSIETATPDGYWYRLAGPPWNGQFYAVANTFTNGDEPGVPGTHHTDMSIPDCRS